jgi:hypothetical protein
LACRWNAGSGESNSTAAKTAMAAAAPIRRRLITARE